ncbi:MAG: Ig-like domain-containing protein [Nanoarchaeota archaeon]|nr:hypothetical protein [Nanoarchaeota archaeon]MBU1030280.1 hypothetical protein [Nanoarchaeota archaeon]MBU1850057.1 hypothetical protein [Nanoarchaeota archaeon]
MKQAKTKIIIVTLMFLILASLISSTIENITPTNNVLFNNTNITFTFDLTDYSNTTSCELIIDSETKETTSANDENSFQAIVSEGTHEWNIVCEDENNTQSTATRTLTIDLTSPTITISNIQNNTNYTNITSIEFTVEDDNTETISCDIDIDSEVQTITVVNQQEETHNVNLAEGEHELEITCEDEAGNKQTSEKYIFRVENEEPEAFISITTNKEEYDLGEEIQLTINALDGSNVTIDVCPDSSGFVLCYPTIELINENYPKIIFVQYTNKTGPYTIEAALDYENIVLTNSLSYETINNIKVKISGDNILDEDESTELEVSVSGGIGNITYLWDLSNGSTSSKDELNIEFDEPGKYEQIVYVTDEKGNKNNDSIIITVKKRQKVIFEVRSLETGSPIKDAVVEIDSETGKTNSKGQVTFYISDKRYSFSAWKTGYELLEDEIRVKGNTTKIVELETRDDSAPQISIESPNDKASTEGTTVDITFKVTDDSPVTCSIYLLSEQNWYEEKDSKIVVLGKTNNFELTNLDYKEYSWRLECEDSQGNSAKTTERTFKVLSKSEASIKNKDEMIEELYDLIDKMKGAGLQESRAVEALQIEKQIKETIVLIDRTERDINALQYRKDISEEQKVSEEEKLRKKLQESYLSSPKNIKVLDTHTFVKYIRDLELEPIAGEYVDIKNYPNKQKFFEASKKTQTKATVSSNIKLVELEYLSGEKKTLTLVEKELKYTNSTDRLDVVEYIPKELATDVSEISIMNVYKVLKADPMISFDTPQKIVYYFEKEIELAKLENTNTVLFEQSYNLAMSAITGQAIFDFNIDLDKKYVWTIIILIVLLTYAFHSFVGFGKVGSSYHLLFGDRNIHTVNMLINDALDNMDAGENDKAQLIYQEIKLYYEKLSVPGKNEVYESIEDICHKLDYAYCQDLINVLSAHLKNNELPKAQRDYQKLQTTYKQLTEDGKKELYDQIKKLDISRLS